MAAGFVLVGGRSSRMGRDKALLALGGTTLLERVSAAVRAAASSVTLVGPPGRYPVPWETIPDLRPGCGPLAGIESALAATQADWNLITACDMPALDARFLAFLVERALTCERDALVPEGPEGRLEPLCAVYHRRALGKITAALDSQRLRLTDAVAGLGPEVLRLGDAAPLLNCNTPEEWLAHVNSVTGRRG